MPSLLVHRVAHEALEAGSVHQVAPADTHRGQAAFGDPGLQGPLGDADVARRIAGGDEGLTTLARFEPQVKLGQTVVLPTACSRIFHVRLFSFVHWRRPPWVVFVLPARPRGKSRADGGSWGTRGLLSRSNAARSPRES